MVSNTNMFGPWQETEVAKEILSKKYYHEGEDFEKFTDRIASILSEEIKADAKKAMYDADFFPGGRSLYGAGAKGKFKASLSNCYILPSPEDTLESINEVAGKMARIFSMGGGCGLSLSNLRPKDAIVYNSARSSTGAVSFINIFNAYGDVIGAHARRAALLVGLDCSHPDIYEFLEIKQNDTAVQSANLSILFTDEFMEAVEADEEYELKFDVKATGEKIRKKIRARDLFWKFCEAQFSWGEPGAIFIDRVRSYNLLSGYPKNEYQIDICNPCAEFFGNSYNSCNLGSINLYNAVKNPFTKDAEIDWDKLAKMVHLGIEILDEILDYGYDSQPLDENRKCIDKWRAIGLGAFGLGDALVALNIKYGSPEAVELAKKMQKFILIHSLSASSLIASEKGTFAAYDWNKVKKSPLISSLKNDKDWKNIYKMIETSGLRNGALISVAPNGCQKPETLLTTNDGILRLNEIVNVNGPQWQPIELEVQQESSSSTFSADKGYINGKAKTKKITLKSGIDLESTPNHQFRVIRDKKYQWVKAEDLVEGDIIPAKIGGYKKETNASLQDIEFTPYRSLSKVLTPPKEMTSDLAFILGAYYANGSTHDKGIRFSMNANKKDDIEAIRSRLEAVFGVSVADSIDETSPEKGKCSVLYFSSVYLLRWLEENGLTKSKNADNGIPKAIRTSSKEVIKSFIDGYFMCDGSHNSPRGKIGTCYIDTVSYQMAQDLAICCRAIGQNIKIHTYTDRSKSLGNKPLHRVFFSKFGSIGMRDAEKHSSKQKRADTELVRELVGEDFIADYVETITDSECETYDISVPKNNCYVANGVVSHNTIATMVGMTGGAEPIFALSYERTTHANVGKGVFFRVLAKSAEHFMKLHNLPADTSDEELMKMNPAFICSHDVPPLDRVKMQAALQDSTDNAISSTVNLKEEATVDDIYNVYMEAWKSGCKGITTFRNNCSRTSILRTSHDEEFVQGKIQFNSISPISSDEIGDEVDGKKVTRKTACVPTMVNHIYSKEGNLVELYTDVTQGCSANINTITRLASLSLRSGVKVEEVLKQLRKETCSACIDRRKQGDKEVAKSCGNAIADAIEKVYTDLQGEKKVVDEKGLMTCPECGEKTLRVEAKCVRCTSCHYSKCD